MLLQLILVVLLAAASLLGTCAAPTRTAAAAHARWSIAIHGGAGTMDPNGPPEKEKAYRDALAGALKKGADMLAAGKDALDVCEAVVRTLEDDPKFNAGKGAVYTEVGTHELDASIMDGRELRCGAVAGVKTVKNPISLARLVMEKSGHVLLMGDGAEVFANAVGVERVPNTYFDTPERREALEKKLRERQEQERRNPQAPTSDAAPPSSKIQLTRAAERAGPDRRDTYGTVGCVVLDSKGNLAAATSTGGLTAKRFGRVGDTPIIGAGNFADNRSAAVSCTGTGEEFIRHTVARDIAALIEHKGWSVAKAADFVVNQRLAPDDGGVIAVSRTGQIAMVFNTGGMYRGAADSAGRFEVAIFKDK
jgi:beta-aspartyl-peptidase (threonine type)